MANECGCGTSNCDCAYKTSDISLWDGVFTNITVPAGASLNDVLALLENYITTSASCSDVNYTLNAYSTCLGLAAGTYSFQQMITAIVNRICANASSIADLQAEVNNFNANVTTSDVTLSDITFPSCFTAYSSITTSSQLFQIIMNNLCQLLDETGPVITGEEDGPDIVIDPAESGVNLQSGETNANAFYQHARMEHLMELMTSITDNNSFIYEHLSPTVSPTSFSVTLEPMKGFVQNYMVIRKDQETLTVNALKDTYFYLSAAGHIARVEVPNGNPAPTNPKGSHNLYKIVSDGSGVTGVTNLYETEPFTGLVLGVDDVATVNIQDGAVTSAKMADVVAGSTEGDAQLFEITFNNKGQITAMNYNISIAGLSNGHILKYNSGTGVFENAANTTMPSANYLPKGNGGGTDLVDSTISENGSQVQSEKRIEINSGAPQSNAESGLNIVQGTLVVARLTAAAASALSLVNGSIVYVIDTDATFTSVGFWGCVAGAWTKL